MITPEEFAKRMRKIADNSAADREMAHGEADQLLCETLFEYGYREGLEIYAS